MHEELTVGYHQQDTNYYCGAACAQMVLHSVGTALGSQDDLYNDNHNHSVEPQYWSTPPDGLQWTLNNRQSAGKYFALDSFDAEDPISRMICWTIHFWKVSPVALVESGNHWVVVNGYTASAAPSSWDDLSYTISSFDLRDPWPPTPAPAPPPPHTDGDTCGTGGVHGVADVNVSYATWQSDYMNANTFGSQWLGKYVAVCDPHPPPLYGLRPLPERIRPHSGERILPAALVQEELPLRLEEAGLLAHPRWSDVIRGVRAGEPVLVQRLDRSDSYYWIVPAEEDGAMRAAVSIDARFGDYREAMILRGEGSPFIGFRSAEEVVENIAGRRFELPDDGGRLLVRPEGTSVHPCLVWKPCRESLSPFYPFRMISVGPFRIYVRIFDGAVFTSLSNDRGGI